MLQSHWETEVGNQRLTKIIWSSAGDVTAFEMFQRWEPGRIIRMQPVVNLWVELLNTKRHVADELHASTHRVTLICLFHIAQHYLQTLFNLSERPVSSSASLSFVKNISRTIFSAAFFTDWTLLNKFAEFTFSNQAQCFGFFRSRCTDMTNHVTAFGNKCSRSSNWHSYSVHKE